MGNRRYSLAERRKTGENQVKIGTYISIGVHINHAFLFIGPNQDTGTELNLGEVEMLLFLERYSSLRNYKMKKKTIGDCSV